MTNMTFRVEVIPQILNSPQVIGVHLMCAAVKPVRDEHFIS